MSSVPPVAAGEVLAGKYRVERVLGQGGMGIVLAARHVHLEEPVAVKLMLSEATFNQEAVGRFLREARAAARLESAHVARVSDVGTLEDGRPYMVMEYLDGSDLSQVLASSGPLAVGDAVDFVLQAAEAIAEAHSIGIVHRDLKPSNLFLTRRRDRTPHVKVLDFGISKVAPTGGGTMTDHAMTKTSALMGSPLYMSPEQMTSVRDVDGRADIWALGIILYELVSGSPPFIGETLPQVCALVLQSDPPPLSSRRPDVPPELDAVVARCLAKMAAQRYQSIAELAGALRGLAGRYGRPSIERIMMLAGGEEPASSAAQQTLFSSGSQPPVSNAVVGTHAAWGDTRPPTGRRRSAAAIMVALLALPVLAAGAWWALRPHVAASPSPDSSATVVTGAEPSPSVPEPTPSAAVPPAVTEAEPSPSAAPPASSPAVVASPSKPAPMIVKKPFLLPSKPLTNKPEPTAAEKPVVVAPKAIEAKKPATSMGGRL
jgi:serine/threonine-protein kinase